MLRAEVVTMVDEDGPHLPGRVDDDAAQGVAPVALQVLTPAELTEDGPPRCEVGGGVGEDLDELLHRGGDTDLDAACRRAGGRATVGRHRGMGAHEEALDHLVRDTPDLIRGGGRQLADRLTNLGIEDALGGSHGPMLSPQARRRSHTSDARELRRSAKAWSAVDGV